MSPFGSSPNWGQGFWGPGSGSSHTWSQGFGPPSPLLFVGALIVVLLLAGLLAVVLLQRQRPQPVAARVRDSSAPVPERLLAERYARGEFDDDEYQRRLNTLKTNYP
jgi:putative membrane protein